MKPLAIARFRDSATFAAHVQGVAPRIRLDRELEGAAGPLGRPLAVMGRVVDNRFVVHPMEGWDGTHDGRPSEWTRRRWRRFGESGAAWVWGGEAYAVRADGRANPNQLCPCGRDDARADLESLRAELLAGRASIGRGEGGFLDGLQLTHSGRWSRPEGRAAPLCARRDPRLDARVGRSAADPLLSDAELEGIAECYVEAARAARDAGFAFVDVKACHGYLLHELLAARDRPGPYGGSLAGRMRLLLRIVEAVRTDARPLEVGVRLSVAELLPHRADAETGEGRPEPLAAGESVAPGFGISADGRSLDLSEAYAVLEALFATGVGAVNVTLGSPYTCPHLQRPAATPPSDGYRPPRDPLHEVALHLEATAAVKARFPERVVVGTGYSYLQDYAAHVAQHELREGRVDAVGLGRMMLAYPHFARDVLAGRPVERKLVCRTFSDCTTAARHGLRSGCYPLDPDYKSTPEAKAVRALRPEPR